jgi:hypothetical protein
MFKLLVAVTLTLISIAVGENIKVAWKEGKDDVSVSLTDDD